MRQLQMHIPSKRPWKGVLTHSVLSVQRNLYYPEKLKIVPRPHNVFVLVDEKLVENDDLTKRNVDMGNVTLSRQGRANFMFVRVVSMTMSLIL